MLGTHSRKGLIQLDLVLRLSTYGSSESLIPQDLTFLPLALCHEWLPFARLPNIPKWLLFLQLLCLYETER